MSKLLQQKGLNNGLTCLITYRIFIDTTEGPRCISIGENAQYRLPHPTVAKSPAYVRREWTTVY